jgi:hypothetical protein
MAGHGYEIGVKLQPYIKGDLEVTASQEGACPNDKEKHEFGIGFTPNYGAELTAEAANTKDEEHPFLEVKIAVCSISLDLLAASFQQDIAVFQDYPMLTCA